MKTKILVVEDEPAGREEILEFLREDGFECVQASNGEEGLDCLRKDKEINLVVTDLAMPGKSGLQMIEAAKAAVDEDRIIEYIVLTGEGGSGATIEAIQLGVLDFLSKPFSPFALMASVRRAEQTLCLRLSNRHYQMGLEMEVYSQTNELKRISERLESAYAEAIHCLAVASEYKDEETANHSRRIGEYARLVAKELGWDTKGQEAIALAAPLHDVGKVGTPDHILLKPGKLDADEILIMKNHTLNGYEILSHSKHPVMQIAANIAKSHHERWDGSGYPFGLEGSQIPIEARIAGLVDVYDALRSERPYKAAFSHEKAVGIILDGDGRVEPRHFDPALIDLMKRIEGEFNNIFEQWAD